MDRVHPSGPGTCRWVTKWNSKSRPFEALGVSKGPDCENPKKDESTGSRRVGWRSSHYPSTAAFVRSTKVSVTRDDVLKWPVNHSF